MNRSLLALPLTLLLASHLGAQTVDDLIGRYVKTSGGIDAIRSVTSLHRTGRFIGGGGFEAVITQENKRPDKVREDFILQGLDQVVAWDGREGWKIDPFSGKKDPESLGEEELKGIVEDADFDSPLIDYRSKGNKVEYIGMEPVEGTDTYKIKVTLANGDTRIYFLDSEFYVPIKMESTLIVRGAERTYETSLGDYKAVNGWFLPFAVEVNSKGSQNRAKYAYDKIEANTPMREERFARPGSGKAPQPVHPPDASEKPPGKQDTSKPNVPATPPPAAKPSTTGTR